MEDAGKDAVAIKLATGWERGGDGKWRYEIPDIDRETVVKGLREPIKAHRKAVNDMERQEERLQGQAFSVSYKIPKRLDSRFTEEEKAKYRQMREKAAALEGEALSVRKEINALKDKVEKEGYETTLGDVLGKDSELIKAYPSLSDVKVKVFEHFTVHLDEGSVAQVQETNRKAIEQESGVLAQHRKQQEAIFRKQSERLADIISRGEGVWISLRIFYIIAPIALFSIFAWVIYFSFWIYFHWIA